MSHCSTTLCFEGRPCTLSKLARYSTTVLHTDSSAAFLSTKSLPIVSMSLLKAGHDGPCHSTPSCALPCGTAAVRYSRHKKWPQGFLPTCYRGSITWLHRSGGSRQHFPDLVGRMEIVVLSLFWVVTMGGHFVHRVLSRVGSSYAYRPLAWQRGVLWYA